MIRHALVTGASGFVGRVLCQRLAARGITITALSRAPGAGPWDHAVNLDLARESVPPGILEGIDTVFHLAGRAHALDGEGSGNLHTALSVDGTRRLLDACAVVQRFVYFSSVKAMCEATPPDCLNEDAPPLPGTDYGRARLQAEALVLAARPPLHTAVIRLPLVYGPGVRGNLARLMGAVARRRAPLLPDWRNRRSLVHVEDACDAGIAAALTASARARVYLVTDGRCYSTREILLHMYEAAGLRPPPWPAPVWALRLLARLGDGAKAIGIRNVGFDGAALSRLSGHACFDSSRAHRELGFVPRHDLQKALPAMFEAMASLGGRQ